MFHLDNKHPDSSPGVEQVHHVLVQLIQVEGVDPLLRSNQNVLVPGVGMDPARGAVDLQWTPIKHFAEAGSHVHLSIIIYQLNIKYSIFFVLTSNCDLNKKISF